MKKAIALSIAGLLLAGAAVATNPHQDPQHKYGIYYEPGVFHDGDPATPDQPFVAYVAWDGNDFIAIASAGTLDLSDLNTVQFWEYADDSACDGNKRQVECIATEFVYAPTGQLFFSQLLGWSFTTIDSAHAAFVSQDVTTPNGASSVTSPVRDPATCAAVLAKMRSLVTTAGVTPDVRLRDSLCH